MSQMKTSLGRLGASFADFLFFLFLISFFLTVGSDSLAMYQARAWLGGAVFAVCLALRWPELRRATPSWTGLFFFTFVCFELIRFLAAFGEIVWRGSEVTPLLQRYLVAPFNWSFYLCFFTLAFMTFTTRKQVNRVMWTAGWAGFFLAVNAIPPLLIRGNTGYLAPDGQVGFFHPIFYAHPFLAKYLFGHFAHPNYTGDVIAMGLFPALGLFFYSLQLLGERMKGAAIGSEAVKPISPASLGLPGTVLVTSALAIILLFSRGTIVCFSIAFLLFLLAALLKYPSRLQLKFGGAVLVLVLGFLFWTGNVREAWEEVLTLKEETDVTEREKSFSTNQEGARRALLIYEVYPLWGVGTDGYSSLSLQFASPGTERMLMAKFKAMCHYLQLLAEEGMGAFLYYLFIAAYFLEALRGLLKVKSRFQFMAGLSFLLPVSMILLHGSFNHLMQRISVSLLVYIYMGISLAIFRKDFEHA